MTSGWMGTVMEMSNSSSKISRGSGRDMKMGSWCVSAKCSPVPALYPHSHSPPRLWLLSRLSWGFGAPDDHSNSCSPEPDSPVILIFFTFLGSKCSSRSPGAWRKHQCFGKHPSYKLLLTSAS